MTNHLVEPHQSRASVPLPASPALPVASEMFVTAVTILQLDSVRNLALRIAKAPEVQAVFTTEYGRQLFVWIVVPNRDYEVYREIFAIEKSLIDDHPGVRFDFTIMASSGKDPVTLVTDPQARLVYVRG